MRASTAAGLVGAAMLSTLIYPFVGLALRKGARPSRARAAADHRRAPPPAEQRHRRMIPALPGA